MFKRALYKLSFLAVIYLAVALLADPLARLAAIRVGEKVFGAKVEIEKVDLGLFPPRLEIAGMTVADAAEPMRNLFQFERTAFSLEGTPLLQKKFIVGEASLTGLKFQGARHTSGALPQAADPAVTPEGPSLTEKYGASAKEFSLEKTGAAKEDAKQAYEIKKEDLESYKLAEQLQQKYAGKGDAWSKKWDDAKFDERQAALKAAFDAAQAENDKLKKVKAFQKVLKDSKNLTDEVKASKKAFDEDMAKAKSDLQAVQDAKKRDTDLVMSKLKLPSLDAESLSKFLLGPDMAAKLEKALHWIRWARSRMPAKQTAPAPPAHGAGRTVTFPVEHAYPTWAIRKILLTGEIPLEGAAPLAVEGAATGLTSEQALLGQPAELHLHGAGFKLDGVFDHRADVPSDSLRMSYKGIPVGARALGNADSISVQVSPGKGELSADITAKGEDLNGRLVFAETGVSLTPTLGPKGGGALVSKVAGAAFSGLNSFDAVVQVKGTLSKPDFGISSSLGTAFAAGIKKAVGGEVEAQRKQVEAKIAALAGDKVDGVQKSVEGASGKVLGKLGKHGDGAKDLEKKIQDGIDAAQKSVLPGGGKSPDLKKLFKR